MDRQDPIRNPPPPPSPRLSRRGTLRQAVLAGLGTLLVLGIILYIVRLTLHL